jgi:hypothetical protein
VNIWGKSLEDLRAASCSVKNEVRGESWYRAGVPWCRVFEGRCAG